MWSWTSHFISLSLLFSNGCNAILSNSDAPWFSSYVDVWTTGLPTSLADPFPAESCCWLVLLVPLEFTHSWFCNKAKTYYHCLLVFLFNLTHDNINTYLFDCGGNNKKIISMGKWQTTQSFLLKVQSVQMDSSLPSSNKKDLWSQ